MIESNIHCTSSFSSLADWYMEFQAHVFLHEPGLGIVVYSDKVALT